MKLAGLNISQGIERVGGDEETYLGILCSFAAHTRPLLDSISEIRADGWPITPSPFMD